jgi:hypothetical protein
MDSNLTQRRRGLEEKIPDIKKTLSMVEFLRDRRVRYRKYTKGVVGRRPFFAPPTFSLSLLFSVPPLSDKSCGGVLSLAFF